MSWNVSRSKAKALAVCEVTVTVACRGSLCKSALSPKNLAVPLNWFAFVRALGANSSLRCPITFPRTNRSACQGGPKLENPDKCCPNSGYTLSGRRALFGRGQATKHRHRAQVSGNLGELGEFDRFRAYFGRFRADVGRVRAKACRILTSSANVGRCRAKFGRCRANFGLIRLVPTCNGGGQPDLAEFVPTAAWCWAVFACVRPEPAKSGVGSKEFAQIRP